jgi:NADPH:quinone reductase-like Zn-dependent oxidoreductase
MKAFVVEHYGKDGLRPADVPEPEVGAGDVLVKVSAAGINPLDMMVRNGEFKRLLKHQTPFVLGHDVAGAVTRVGSAVRDFQVGDEVYARPRDLRIGTFAEYVAIDQDDVAPKPASLTLHEAAAVPLVSLAAWQALVDRAHVKPGQKVLVHAGSGGLGSTVIQLAKHLGATVATTASGKNAELVRSLGADVVIDYTNEDFAEVLSGYDVVVDSRGGENLERALTILKPGGQAIGVAGPPDPGFAKQLGAPKLMGVVMGLLSRKVQAGAGARRELLVSVHAGQRRPAARAGRPLRRRPPPPAHRQDVPVRPDPRGAGVRRAGPRQRQGRHHARLTTPPAARRLQGVRYGGRARGTTDRRAARLDEQPEPRLGRNRGSWLRRNGGAR